MNLKATFLPRPFLLLCLCLIWTLLSAAAALAGGGPENVLLVVNPKSPASLTIANHYVELRQIPAANILYLPWDPKAETTDVAAFRRDILLPVFDAVHRRPEGQIDYVVYSSDFPWGIDLQADVKQFEAEPPKPAADAANGESPPPPPPKRWPKVLTPVGAITGLTYLCELVLPEQQAYFYPQANLYAPPWGREPKEQPTRAFSSAQHFQHNANNADSTAAVGVRYVLSVMLGVTAGRGNTVNEVLAYLRRSAAADGTHPRGTIYYCQNGDIRSRVRQDLFPQAVAALAELGVRAEIVNGVLPQKKNDVQGVMVGAADFDWRACGSAILPGAICEHFTSFGGEMHARSGQTPLSEFLRYGAAGASGTVTEPFAIRNKFPSPMIQVHYARGCSLAEAFYQSVSCPYQLLIVGDPLCRPWADIPQVSVAGIAPGATLHGVATFKPKAVFRRGAKVDHFELFVDGLRAAACPAANSLAWDTASAPDGWHEVRVVAVESGPIRSQGRLILPLVTANHKRTIEASIAPKGMAKPGEPLVVKAKSPGCRAIVVLQGTRLLGLVKADQGTIKIDPAELGVGPVRLQVIGLGQPIAQTAIAKPIELTVERAEKK